MHIRRLPLWGALAGIGVGLIIAALMAASGSLDDRATAAPKPPATAPFLAAFKRSLTGTYVVQATFTRQLDSGRMMTSNALVAQAPPDHVRREFGGISGAINGHGISCNADPNGGFTCGPGPTAELYPQKVASDMANLASYFKGPIPLYRVVRTSSECFALTQVRPMFNAPYGSYAEMCFDPATGAMSKVLTKNESATDTFQAVHISASVTPSDLALGQDKAYDPKYHNDASGG